jgi:hypothetical protein
MRSSLLWEKRTAWPVKMVPTACPETLATNYQSILRTAPRKNEDLIHHWELLRSCRRVKLGAREVVVDVRFLQRCWWTKTKMLRGGGCWVCQPARRYSAIYGILRATCHVDVVHSIYYLNRSLIFQDSRLAVGTKYVLARCALIDWGWGK